MCAFRRSRHGCVTCKKRKKKCDLAKPTCDNCSRLGLKCQGYVQRILWEDGPARNGIKRRGPRKLQQVPNGSNGKDDKVQEIVDEVDTSIEGCASATQNHDRFLGMGLPEHLASNPFNVEDIDTLDSINDSISNSSVMLIPFDSEANAEDFSAPTTDLTLCRPPSTTILSPMEPLLWDYYVNFFSRSYPTCSDANNPFLSCLIPIAFQYDSVRHTLLALAALQAKHTYHGSIDREMHRLRRSALEACRKVTDRARGSQSLSLGSRASDATHFGFPGAMLLLGRDEKMVLVTIAVLLILFAKLSGANYESIRSYMDFAREYFVFEETFGSHNDAVGQTPFYMFLRSLLSYNELLSCLAIKKTASGVGHGPIQSMTPDGPLLSSQQEFLTLLARTSKSVEDVSPAEFDHWDGKLNFIPSYSVNSGPSPTLAYPLLNTTSTKEDLNEDIIVGKIYRAAGRTYYYQQLRDRWAIPHASTAPFCPPHVAQKQIDFLAAQAVDLFRSLGDDTRYNTALLLPLGIIGPELRTMSHRAFVLAKLDFLYQTLHFDHYNVFSKDLIQAWARLDAEDQPQHPLSFQRWILSLPTRLIG